MKRTSTSRTIYLKILVSIIVLIVLVTMSLSVVLYINFERAGLSLIHTFIKDSLSQVSYSASFMTQSAKALASQTYFNPDVAKLYSFSPPDPREAGDAVSALNIYHSTAPYLHSIYIYSGQRNIIYTNIPVEVAKNTQDFFDTDIINILDNFRNYSVLVPIPRRIPNPVWDEKDNGYSNVYSFIFYELPGSLEKLPSAIVLNISESYMQDIANTLDLDKESYTYIVDKNGIMVSSNKLKPMLFDISNDAHVKTVLASQESTGYFIENVDGVKSLITYVASPHIGWWFIRITPYEMITQKMDNIRYITLIVVILILLCGLILTRYISKKLHKPIDSFLMELKALESQQRSNNFTLKCKLFMDIFNGGIEFDTTTVKNKFAELKINLKPEEPLALIMLKIDNQMDFCSKYNYDDRYLMKFGIINIASELCSSYSDNEAVDAGDDSIIMIINTHDSATRDSDEFKLLLDNIQQSILQHLEISVTLVVSAAGKSISDLNALYEKILDASRYRIIFGHQSIIYDDVISMHATTDYIYPAQKEKHLIDAIMLEKMDESKKIYSDIVNEAKIYSYSTLNLVLLRLAFTVNASLEEISRNVHFSFSHDLNAFTSNLNKAETLNEINELFINLFDQFTLKLEEKKDAKYDQLVEKIIETIYNSYMDQNLTIYSVSESVNMSPIYLGRLFKRLTSKSVADYINDIRMEKAKNLLLNTDKSVKEIVDETGYSNTSYFFTLFKKMHGITPNDFRQNGTN